MARNRAIVCFGELLLRLNAPGRERLLQSQRLDVHVGGAEANVAVSLAQFGHEARFASVVADNALGEAALGELRRYGVDVSPVARASGRMGLYFMASGATRRPSEIIYDRAGSVFAEAGEETLDWPAILDGAGWLHVSGVTPAVGPKPAAAALKAVRTAKECGVKVSFDGNYRAQLWAAWGGDGPAILRRILACADLAFINERDVGLVLGRDFPRDEAGRRAAFAAAFEAFPGLELIAATRRRQHSVDHHALTAVLATRDGGERRSREWDLSGVVDRIGAGDAFAAGTLRGLIAGHDHRHTVEFAAAAAALKHSMPGDFNIATVADVERALAEDDLDVRR
ncbi:sugar kinase [Amphiplicatus metriothermophilus]|uniref:2-dehydro-3-deoxygluconokinase n=1 Tax=Amphiplicatus metriothermophilus TaxID=1519374 RepID=A0A239PTB9_9PROT|nr:sugar kinase [Amphiplicatus metriothermophilus]MBB5519390.1 2-dehydro-3-deoxygluconokinase [Amphiplicatus metriothermophilus]SNT73525.1 2-dehydro-3-deoxygluconokinase [Amphiplicatus metriothermophilus]